MESHAQAPIGVFDSGLGGLTIARQIRQLLPAEDILYLADQANVPYGEKTPEEILKLTKIAIPTLIAEGAKIIVVACNSASLTTIDLFRTRFADTPFVAVVPMIKDAAERTKTGTVAVFATKATLGSPAYAALKDMHAAAVNVIDIPCPSWVTMVESGEHVPETVDRPVRQALDAGADQLVLGCTHYPFLTELLRTAVAGKAALLEPGEAVARQVRHILTRNDTLKPSGKGETSYLTSGDASVPSEIASRLLGKPVSFRTVGHWDVTSVVS
ncbi:MAG: glutamate racemase [bacterium]|nr:glutamate racemase [bacterium]